MLSRFARRSTISSLPILSSLSCRSISDRSFRLANVGDLAVAQEFKDQVTPEHFVAFSRTTEVNPRELSKQLVIDLSHEQGYKRGHIKGAVNLPLEKFDFCRLIDSYGGITQEEVYSVMKSIGVCNDTSEIILYDNSGLLACRLWFVLRYFGFTNVRILNGGWRAWLRTRLPVEEKETVKEPVSVLDLKPKRDNLVKKPTQMIFDHESKRSIYIDLRRAEAYQAYHIPRAINIPCSMLMQDGEFESVKNVRDLLMNKQVNAEDQSIILYSSKGLTSAVGYFCLTMAGVDRVAVYDAGIHNWVTNFEDKLSPEAIERLGK